MNATPPPTLAAAERHPWSATLAAAYRDCPAKYGFQRARAPRVPATLDQRRGRVLHEALSAAYRAAQTEGRDNVLNYPIEDTMYRHYLAARRALGAAWEAEQMPRSSAEANDAVEVISALLHSLPLPRPGEILAVEQTFHGVTSGGIAMQIRPDLVLRKVNRSGLPGPRITVVDWKSGAVEKEAPARTPQLLTYVAVLADLNRTVREFVVRLHSIRKRHHAEALADPDRVAGTVLALESTAVDAAADTRFGARPGEQCMGCAFRGICPDAWPPATLGLPREASGEFVTVAASAR